MEPTVFVQKQPGANWKLPFSASELARLLAAMCASQGCEETELELSILGDTAMEALHRESSGCNGPTNILSFAVRENSDASPILRHSLADAAKDRPMLGWLALSADTFLRECFLYGQQEEEHCVRLLAHGLAHLMGHDHGPEMEQLCVCLEAAAHAACAESIDTYHNFY